jgi:hypothetical protein
MTNGITAVADYGSARPFAAKSCACACGAPLRGFGT